jgi:hypothetical protein
MTLAETTDQMPQKSNQQTALVRPMPFRSQADVGPNKQYRNRITKNSNVKAPDSGKPILDPI